MNEIAKRAYDNANKILKIDAVPFEEEESRGLLLDKAREFSEKGVLTINDIPLVPILTQMAVIAYLTGVVANKRHPSFSGNNEEIAKIASDFACETMGVNLPWETTTPQAKESLLRTVEHLRKGEDDGMIDLALTVASDDFCLIESSYRAYVKHLLDVTVP